MQINFVNRKRDWTFSPHGGPLTDEEIERLHARLVQPITDAKNVALLSPLTRRQREQFSRATKSVVLYFGDEVPEVVKAEELAAMSSAPLGYRPEALVGLNVGCGTRTISPYLLSVDIMRQGSLGKASGEHSQLNASAFLALSDDLPFRPNTIDYIVALHMLEHVEDPVGTINHWLDIVKPGGGIGIIVPDWRFTWDSRNDRAPFGHKWNPTPDLIRRLYKEHWSSKADLQQLDTYEFAMSFDFVLRKHGRFVPFAAPDPATIKSGYQRNQEGVFLHGD
ncbi:methyltransferase domain-containing protein [Mesorhizobium humile]|uniref:Methyltransferase domain-containing protein n=1 Tax=Mesorhizobium humile TaxID=3072313 RepID=A0ABU4YDH9_9HYPH|nr:MULTISPECIES: methyltransferase domain-containing protein [unclassified Mesorhizobium]MDX8459208.1 methyltransferase domain-containing protein [Mesorhizobium sp. VK2D]MDX8484991.1 methyltransferase domain-containing protein [Mesorhizobium sp. VK2B]